MITFPQTLAHAAAAEGELRAGATDLQERRHQHISTGPIVDLRDVPGLDRIVDTLGGGLRVGALVPIQQLADDERVRRAYPGLAAAAGDLATPQIRARGTVGGNLLQKMRCWYYRNPAFSCLRSGGSSCLARSGDHYLHAVFDQGPCVCVHPSTLAAAFIAWGATVEVHGGEQRSLAAVAANNVNPTRDTHLEEGEVLEAVLLPPAVAGERSSYTRTISRSRAEWPLVEAVVRISPSGAITAAVLGGVANQPVPLALQGDASALSREAIAAVVKEAGGAGLPMTHYKVQLIPDTVLDAVAKALEGPEAESLKPVEDEEGGE